MGVKSNSKSRLALLFDADANDYESSDIAGTINGSPSRIDVRSSNPIVHEGLAPSFGNNELVFQAMKDLDDQMKDAILVSTNKLLELENSGDLSWNRIIGVLNANPVLVTNNGSQQVVKEFVSETSAYFKSSKGSPNPSLVRKVLTWWESEACPDPDIRADSRLDIDSLAKVVARSGATINSFSNFLFNRQHHEHHLFEVGVMRYPTLANPYFKVYCIKLFAWSDYSRLVWHQENKNGIKSTVSSQIFTPNDIFFHRPSPDVMIKEDVKKNRILNDIRHLLEDEQRSKKLVESTGEDAQLWLDTLQALAKLPEIPTRLRSSTLKTMLRLSKKSDLIPKCLIINNVEKLGEHPVGYGGFGDLWKGKVGGQVLGLKVPRISLASDTPKLLRDYNREAIVWQQLDHPNVLPFMGIYYLNQARTQLCLVSPWMEQGNLANFLASTPKEVDHYLLVHDVASGLAYLHEKKVVHGDLKGVNVLITADGRACIGDFGLSRVVDGTAIQFTSLTSTSSKGTTRWSAPELFEPPYTMSTFSDIYAFAGVCYEVFTGKVPFHGLNDGAIILAVMHNKEHPSRPDSTLLNDGMWKIMEDCWNFDPQLRPTAFDVVGRVAALNSFKSGSFKPAAEWDASSLAQIWKDAKCTVFDTEALVRLQRDLESLVGCI